MKIFAENIKIKTAKNCEFINITKKIKEIVKTSKIKNGIVNIFSKHTTLAIKVNEHEKLLLKDIHDMMKRIAPRDKDYFHDRINLRENCPPNEPKNAPAHLMHMVFETFQTIPISKKEIQLGQFQSIFAIEMSGPRERDIFVQVIGN